MKEALYACPLSEADDAYGNSGMTTRCAIAAQLLAAMVGATYSHDDRGDGQTDAEMVAASVAIADHLLAELAKEPTT